MPSRYQISTVVQKKLKDLNLTAEEVIRKALEIKAEGLDAGDGVFFPEGTAFLAWYKDLPRWGIVKNGAVEIEKERFTSVSGAAAKVTGRPTTNGWDFWLVKMPGKNEFVPIKSFRNSK
jgi:hypothetical protein